MVHDDKAGTDCHQSVAQTVQPNPSASGSEHATASAGNSIQEWHRTWRLEKGEAVFGRTATGKN
jgi:hypothetical protein